MAVLLHHFSLRAKRQRFAVVAQGKQNAITNVGCVIGQHHRAAGGNERQTALLNVDVLTQRRRIKADGIFAIRRERWHDRVAAAVGMDPVVALRLNVRRAGHAQQGNGIAQRLAKRDAILRGDNASGESKTRVATVSAVVITEADVAVATIVLQRQAGAVGLSLTGLTLLNAVIQVAVRQRAAVE